MLPIFTFCCAAVENSLICLAFSSFFFLSKEPLRIVDDYIWMLGSLSQLTRAASLSRSILSIVLPDCNCGAELEANSHGPR